MLSRMVICATSVAFMASSAYAADIYSDDGGSFKDEPIAYEPASVFSGFYVGAFGGWAGANTDATDIDDREFGPGVTESLEADGAFWGATLGYNVQRGSWVYGPEVEAGFINIDELSINDDNAISTQYGAYGVIGGRLGYAFNRSLFYGKLGLALADIESRAGEFDGVGNEDDGGIDGFDGNESGFGDEVRYGLAIGGGLEHAFSDKLSFKVEYLYMNFGNETFNGFEAGVDDSRYEFDDDLHTVKFGLNYKLGAERDASFK